MTSDADFADLVLTGPTAEGPADEAAAADMLAAALARSGPKVRPPASGLESLLLAVGSGNGEGRKLNWRKTPLPGIFHSVLDVDAAKHRVTVFVRLDPGARIPPHTHGGEEDLYVVRGNLSCEDGTVLRAGDYLRSPAGSFHSGLWSDEGCLCVMVSSVGKGRDGDPH